MNLDTARIARVWQNFDNQVNVDYQGGERIYGVYYHFESDVNGKFNLLAGYDKGNSAIEKVTIQKGRYLFFKAIATTPDDKVRVQIVVECWGEARPACLSGLVDYIFSRSLGVESSESVKLVSTSVLDQINEIRQTNGKDIWYSVVVTLSDFC